MRRSLREDLLVKVDTDVIERSMAELETQLELAEVVFERQQRLWDQEIGPEIEYLQEDTTRVAPALDGNPDRAEGHGRDARPIPWGGGPLPRQDRGIRRSRRTARSHCKPERYEGPGR